MGKLGATFLPVPLNLPDFQRSFQHLTPEPTWKNPAVQNSPKQKPQLHTPPYHVSLCVGSGHMGFYKNAGVSRWLSDNGCHLLIYSNTLHSVFCPSHTLAWTGRGEFHPPFRGLINGVRPGRRYSPRLSAPQTRLSWLHFRFYPMKQIPAHRRLFVL